MKKLLRVALAALTLVLPLGAQTTWYVDVNGAPPGDGSQANPYTSLQDCFAQGGTVDGDTVLVSPGTYVEHLNLLGKSLDVRSISGAASTTLQPAISASVLRVVNVANGRLEGFTLRGGMGTATSQFSAGGGVIVVNSTFELQDCELRENQADKGGAVAVFSGSTLSLRGCLLTENDAQQGGGIYAEAGVVVGQDTMMSLNRGDVTNPGNSLFRRGGGVYTGGTAELELRFCEVRECTPAVPQGGGAAFEGAGLFLGGASALLEDCLIASCGGVGTSASFGGGIYSNTNVDLLRTTVRDCTCLNQGGGVYGTATFDDCDLLDNLSTQGGGSYSAASQFTDCRIIGNSALGLEGGCSGPGGGVYGGTLIGCRLEDNRCTSTGAGAFSATLIECEVIANRITAISLCGWAYGGAGLAGAGSATDCLFEGNEILAMGSNGSCRGAGAYDVPLVRCTLRGNRIDGSTPASGSDRFLGGGASACTLVDCVLEGNQALGWGGVGAQGGGVYGGSATDCTIRGNRAETFLPGHAFAMGGGAAKTTLVGCQVFDNEADHGGGAWDCDLEKCSVVANLAHEEGGALSVHPDGGIGMQWGVATVIDSIAWGNLPDELNPGMGSITASYTDVQGGYPGTGNLGADPLFWNEPQGDLHLRAGSPCIDAGDPNAPLDPDGSRRDMGALPYDPFYVGGPYVYCDAKLTSEGCLPAIGFSGMPTVSGPDDFVVHTDQLVPNQNGLLFWGLAPAAAPFMGGLRCVANPIVRTPMSNSGGAAACSGVLSFAFTQSYFASAGLGAGDRLFVQAWFRDPAQPDGTGVGLSDALDFTLLP